MLSQIGDSLTFFCQYTHNGASVPGLTVTINVYNEAGTEVVTAGVATNIGASGGYRYTMAAGLDLAAGGFYGEFHTAGTVDQADLPALWTVGKQWVQDLDLAISTRYGGSTIVPANLVEINGVATSDFAGIATEVSATTVTLDAVHDSQAIVDNAACVISMGGSFGLITASNTSTFEQTLTWVPVTPALGGYTILRLPKVIPPSLAAILAALATAPVGSVANLAGVALSLGTVASGSPVPTSTTFRATGGLNTTPGGYTTAPMSILWQTGLNAGFKYPITGHAVTGSNHDFTVGSVMANIPLATDTFVIG